MAFAIFVMLSTSVCFRLVLTLNGLESMCAINGSVNGALVESAVDPMPEAVEPAFGSAASALPRTGSRAGSAVAAPAAATTLDPLMRNDRLFIVAIFLPFVVNALQVETHQHFGQAAAKSLVGRRG